MTAAMRELAPNSFIAGFEGVLDADTCRTIREGFDRLGLKEYGPAALGSSPDRRCMHAPLDQALADREAVLAVYRAVHEHVEIYRKHWSVLRTVPTMQAGLLIQKYPAREGFYRMHVDAGHPQVFDRILAILLYLNDVETGGETHFPHFDLKVSAREGRMVLFPVHWPHMHAGLEPQSGDKYILTSFLRYDQAQSAKS